MKTVLKFIAIIGLLTLSGCQGKVDPKQVLEKENSRQEVFQAILDNHDYMTDFMNVMQNNDHAMTMMQGNQMMMGHMMQDSSMVNTMMQKMLSNKTMMAHMMQMMTNKGMMSKDCMDNSMSMMHGNMMDNSK